MNYLLYTCGMLQTFFMSVGMSGNVITLWFLLCIFMWVNFKTKYLVNQIGQVFISMYIVPQVQTKYTHYIHTDTHMYTHRHTYTCTYTNTHAYTQTQKCMYTHRHGDTHTHSHTNTHTYTHTSIHTDTHTHRHTHTRTPFGAWCVWTQIWNLFPNKQTHFWVGFVYIQTQKVILVYIRY